jgi:hypothetical protein
MTKTTIRTVKGRTRAPIGETPTVTIEHAANERVLSLDLRSLPSYRPTERVTEDWYWSAQVALTVETRG